MPLMDLAAHIGGLTMGVGDLAAVRRFVVASFFFFFQYYFVIFNKGYIYRCFLGFF